MSDITDKDRRMALAFAREIGNLVSPHTGAAAAARVILATVDAPAPTLAEEIMRLPDYTMSGDHCLNDCYDQAKDLAARAEQIEQERDQALSDLAEMTGFRDSLRTDLDHARAELNEACDELANSEYDRHNLHAEVERLTAERGAATVAPEENVAPDQQGDNLPDPDDVPYGEAWLVEVDGGTVPAIKAGRRRWVYPGAGGYWDSPVVGDWFTLVSRLVPAPRQITTREELYELPDGSIIRDHNDGEAMQKIDGDWRGTAGGEGYDDYCPTATVLWEPEA